MDDIGASSAVLWRPSNAQRGERVSSDNQPLSRGDCPVGDCPGSCISSSAPPLSAVLAQSDRGDGLRVPSHVNHVCGHGNTTELESIKLSASWDTAVQLFLLSCLIHGLL